ncbi:hypothetical protein [Streptomyces sp. 8L]|uniref:hypothetical protein n=1 Tax=Streptomyces sp. 8L TaxID=2877242 RepID=UPI001CD557CB|nr:hypothetical protein [Streptomyces sp. 8L]MCA1221067.1 hypothetical protein [Streptomyces sp. 8L]
MERVRLWWKPVLACVVAVFGAMSLAGVVKTVVEGHFELAGLRAHGAHAAGNALVMTDCGGTRRSYSCDTSAVWLDFTDAHHHRQMVREKEIASDLYEPHGKRDAELNVATTVVYDPADPDDAQPAGAVEQSVLDLARHNLSTLVITVLMAAIGACVALGSWPDRRARADAAAAVEARREAWLDAWRREMDESDEAVRRARSEAACPGREPGEEASEEAGGGA